MADTSATIIAASLNSDDLEKSINKLVETVATKTKAMADNFTSEIARMEQAVRNLGNIKIDSGGAADGGSSRRTKMLLEESLKAKEVTMTYDQMQAAFQKISKESSGLKDIRTFNKEELQSYIELLRKLQAEYVRVNTQEGGGAKSDQIKRDMAELEKIIQSYQVILKNVEMINSRQGTIDVKKWTQDIGAVDDRYKKLVRWYTVLEKEDQRRIANEEKANQKRLAELDKEEKARQKMIESARKAEEKYQNAVLKTAFNKIVDLPSNNIDQMRTKLERLQTILANIRELGILSPKDISNAETEIVKLRGNIQQIEKIEKERIAAERQFVIEQQKEIENLTTIEGRVKSLSQATKQYFAENKGEYWRTFNAYGKDFTIYNPEKSNRANGLSIEEQITNILKEEKAAREGVAQSAQQQSGATQNVVKSQKEESEAIRKNFRDYDSLRQAIASVIGIKTEDVRLYGVEISSINQLSDKLKQLRSVYNQLGTQDRGSEIGKQLILQIQVIERQMDRARKQLSRPIDLKSAFGLSEKTLDDIAYKMRQLASYKMGLNITDPKAMEEMRQVDTAINRLKKQYDDLMGKNKSMIASNNALGRSWNYMKNRLAFYFTVGASTQFVKNLIEVRSQYEMNEKALGILLDSASRGTRIFNELSQMSLVSPYTLIELSSAAKQLTAYDIAAKDVVDTTRRLADMASAVGVPVERLTYALGQIKAYGYLNSRDARMFANAGIPLVKQLADYYSELEGKMVSTADVYDRMKKKAIDYNDVMKVVTKMTDEGGKFFDFQAKMADTLKVRLANLTLAWNNMLNDLGKSNQGTLTTGIKSLTVIFRHWREIYRILSTLIVALGAYKVATMLAGMTTKSSIGSSAVAAWFNLARGVKSAKDAVALFSLTLKSIPFTAWVTTIATLASYLYLFNNSTDGLKQKLEDIATAFDGVRKEITDLYADALKSDSIGSQLTKLRDMLELAQTELGVTIPIKLEEVNEGNVKQKLKEVKNIIDNYLNFSQEFSEAAAGTKFNELMNEFGANARSTYTGISESINTVVVALQDLVDKGNASKRDLKILNELTSGQKEDESRIEYLQRLVRLYEELGLVGKKVTTPSLSFFSSSTDNMNELTEKQNEQLDRLGIKNKQVFENMLKDVQGYYSSSSIAQYQFEQQVERVAKRIDINNIPVEQRTLKLNAAINEEASLNNWNQFEKEFARQVANQKFGTTIEISDESKSVAEQDLKDWQKKQQEWAVKNGITIPINFQTNDTEISYAKRMLQAAKDAKEEVDVQQRKLAVGTGSQDAVDAAKKAYENARTLAKNAGADLEQLDKKANAAAKKAAKAAESELQKALKDELSTIDKVRSIYKDLTKEGMSHADAVAKATKGWNETVNAINKVLQKNGLKKLNLADFVGVDNPREMMKTLQAQLESMVKRGASSSEIKVIQEKIRTLEVDADKYDLTKITKGLNNELDRLKEEYELAVALDADPELGGIFADWMGINLEDLPKTAEEAAKKAQEYIDKILAENNSSEKIDISSLMDKKAFDSWVESSGHNLEDELVKAVGAFRGYLHKVNVDETKNQAQEWNKLLEKYAEYEYKVTQIQKEAEREREVARKKGASQDVFDAINNRERQEIARVGFEEFQKSPEWIAATGDLANMSKSAIGMLIEELERYKRTAKNLSPKEIKQLNNALSKLYKEQRKNNPFKAVANMFDEAKDRMSIFDDEIEEAQKQIDELSKKHKTNLIDGIADDDTQKKLKEAKERLSKLKEERNNIGKIDASTWVSSINETISAVKSAIEVFDGLAKAIDGVENSDVDKVFSILDSAGKGASTGAAFGPYGAIIGGVVGAAAGVVNAFADVWSGNERINKSIEVSTQKVRTLEREYKRLERAVDDAYGTDSIGAQRLMMLNKEAELAELERQLELEKSRKAKNRDQEKIDELRDKVDELRYEVNNAAREIILDLLDIGDAQDWANDFVKGMIDAFREGENYMKSYEDAFREMIDNMIAKTIAGKVIGERIEQMIANIKEIAKTRAEGDASVIAARDALDKLEKQRDVFYAFREGGENVPEEVFDQINKDIADAQKIYDEIYTKAVQPTPEDVQGIRESISSWKDDVKNEFDTFMEAFGVEFGSAKESQQLSALQQGLQGVSEETAGAVEAYLNGMSQQAYLRNELLTQIRDAIMGTNSDIQLGVQGQMLLQLQNNYIIMQSIQSMMEGWTTPSGQGIRVELIS